jgi:hypothetical protein
MHFPKRRLTLARCFSGQQSLQTISSKSQALGAVALGAIALGALAIGRLAIGRARIRRLEIDELIVRERNR